MLVHWCPIHFMMDLLLTLDLNLTTEGDGVSRVMQEFNQSLAAAAAAAEGASSSEQDVSVPFP